MVLTLWYLLYGGQSVDGRGVPHFVGRTTDAKYAKRHHKMLKQPHSIGNVSIVTDTRIVVLTARALFDDVVKALENEYFKD